MQRATNLLPQHSDRPLELNSLYWAWLAEEYHARKHDTTGRAPGQHRLAEVTAGHCRPVPRNTDLDDVFPHRLLRTVRKDGTVRFKGRRLEVSAELSDRAELRFDPSDRRLSRWLPHAPWRGEHRTAQPPDRSRFRSRPTH